MKGYKAFSKGLICRGKQYAENTTFEEEEAVICSKGMHFCKDPLDVLDYYPLVDENGDITEFAEVEALDVCHTDDNKKFCTRKLHIGAKIDFPKLVSLALGDITQSSKNSGDWAKIGSSGEGAKIASSGHWAKIASSGDGAKIASSGDGDKIVSTGKNSVICCAGNNSIVKGKIGSCITLAEWCEVDGEYRPICVKTEYIDGTRIKEDVFYTLKNKEFVEVG